MLALGWLCRASAGPSERFWRCASKVWSVREKLVGLVGTALVALVGWGLPIAVQTHSSLSRIALESLMFGGVFGALYLWRRLRLDRTDF